MKALERVKILDFTHVQSGADLHPVAGLVWCRGGQDLGRSPCLCAWDDGSDDL
jgi:hypothetical protein